MILLSLSRNPRTNLAFEEKLFRSSPKETHLVLYVNRACVVIGRNQDPARETRPELLAKKRIPLVRRFTGGGAVWHDKGNLVFSFIGPKKDFDRERNCGVVLEALCSLGFDPLRRGDRDILIGEKKISGSAYAHSRDASLHHATLLVSADLSRLNEHLRPGLPEGPEEKRFVASVRSETANLISFRPVTMRQVRRALIRSFRDSFGPAGIRFIHPSFHIPFFNRAGI